MCVYLCTKFQVSSLVLMSFRQGGNFTPPLPPTSKQPPKKPTQIKVNPGYSTIHLNFTVEFPQC